MAKNSFEGFPLPKPDKKSSITVINPSNTYEYINIQWGLNNDTTTPTKQVGDFVVKNPGIYRVTFTQGVSSAGLLAYGQIYRNGVPYGTLRSTTGGYNAVTQVIFTEDLEFKIGDVVALYGWQGSYQQYNYVQFKDIKITGDKPIPYFVT